MDIKTSSWHYKYANYICQDVDDVTNLCEYIRKFLFATMYYFLILFLAFIVGALVLLCIAKPFLAVFSYKALFGSILCGLVVFALIFFLIKLGVFLWFKYDDSEFAYKRYLAKENKQLNKKGPNPFIQYLKDKHDKVCSTVNIVD